MLKTLNFRSSLPLLSVFTLKLVELMPGKISQLLLDVILKSSLLCAPICVVAGARVIAVTTTLVAFLLLAINWQKRARNRYTTPGILAAVGILLSFSSFDVSVRSEGSFGVYVRDVVSVRSSRLSRERASLRSGRLITYEVRYWDPAWPPIRRCVVVTTK